MEDQVLTAEQVIPRPREQVFAFFSEPQNLEAITPPWLGFRIVEQTTPGIEEGTELQYRLKLHGIPISWRSRIEEWRPNESFVDTQLSGPYAKWHHTHTFHDHDGGTLIRDRVLYRLPLGALGQWVAGRFVAGDVRRIFEYRKERTHALLTSASA